MPKLNDNLVSQLPFHKRKSLNFKSFHNHDKVLTPPVEFNQKIDFIRNEEKEPEEVESCRHLHTEEESEIVPHKKKREMTDEELTKFRSKFYHIQINISYFIDE